MKTISITSILALLAAGVAGAEVPKKVPPTTYNHLWSNSPFTSKPPPVVPQEQASAFDDWALSGVSQVNGGYLVTLHHKKNQGETQVIKPDRVTEYMADGTAKETPAGQAGVFKVDRVEYSKKGWTETVVHLSAGGRTGTVKFDEKSMVPKPSAAPQQPHGGQQGNGQNNGQNGQNGQPQQQPPNNGQAQQVPNNPQPTTPAVRPPRPRGR